MITENVNADKEKYLKDIRDILKEYKEAKDYQNHIRGEFHDFKIMESFLEGAPQSILQITIILQEETLKQVGWDTWFSIGLSFFTFSLGAAGIYSERPTKVQNLFFKSILQSISFMI